MIGSVDWIGWPAGHSDDSAGSVERYFETMKGSLLVLEVDLGLVASLAQLSMRVTLAYCLKMDGSTTD